MTTTIHLSGPADVLAVLPYQLGFYPRDSLVAVSMRGTRLGLVQRIDLPPPEHVGDAVAAMMAPLRKDSPRSVLLIGFEERDDECRAMLDGMAAACVADGVEVTDRFVVRGERWFAPDCHQRCCPSEGLPLHTPSEVPAVAEFVGRGVCPLPDRSALADRLTPSLPQISDDLSALADGRLAQHEAAKDAGVDELDECRATELDVWARVLWAEVSLTDVDVRDALIAWLCPGTLARELIDPMLLTQIRETLGEQPWVEGQIREIDQVITMQRIERRMCEICAALPDLWAVPALTVLATFTWWRGDGALTRIALERALGIDPRYRLAMLLEQMVDLAIRPERASA